MKSSLLFFFLFSITLTLPAQSGPPDQPITPEEWLKNMNWGSWWIFTEPDDEDTNIPTIYSPKILDSLMEMGIHGGRLHWQAKDDFLPDYTIKPEVLQFYSGVIDDMTSRGMSICLMVHFSDKNMTDSIKKRTFLGWQQVCEAFRNKSYLLAMCPMIEFHGWQEYYVKDGDTIWSTDPAYDPQVRIDSLNWLYDSLTRIFRKTNPERIISYKPWGSARKAQFEQLALPFADDPPFESDEPKYYMVSFSGSYGMGEWWRWRPDMDPDTLQMIKEQTMRAGLSATKDAGFHHAINWRAQTGIQFWIDHWHPAFWKRIDGTVKDHWTYEQNLAYINFFIDTMLAQHTAGAGMQTRQFWNDNTNDLIRLGDNFSPGGRHPEYDTMSVKMMQLLRHKASLLSVKDTYGNTHNITLYPNPAKNLFTIEKPYQLSAELFSITGEKLTHLVSGTNVLTFRPGIYLIVFKSPGGKIVDTRKLIIEQ